MKSMTKILAMILVCIMAFSSVSLAANAQTTNENEPTATTVAETTKEAEKETTTLPADEATTVPEAEATTSDSESTTVLPEETTNREIKLPNAPTNLYCDSYSQEGHCVVNWDVVPEAVDGYDVFLKADDQWVYKTTVIHYTYADLKDLLCGQKYEIGVRSLTQLLHSSGRLLKVQRAIDFISTTRQIKNMLLLRQPRLSLAQ